MYLAILFLLCNKPRPNVVAWNNHYFFCSHSAGLLGLSWVGFCCLASGHSCCCSQVADGAATIRMKALTCLETWGGQMEGWNTSLCLSLSSGDLLCMASLGYFTWWKGLHVQVLPILCLYYACYSLIGESQCGWGLYKGVNNGSMDLAGGGGVTKIEVNHNGSLFIFQWPHCIL